MSNWQPIKTAPKDGSEIIIANQDGSMAVARWIKEKESWYYHWDGECDWATHWMPLPEPPK